MKRETEKIEVILPAAGMKVGNGQGVGLRSSGLRKNLFRIFPRRPYAASDCKILPGKEEISPRLHGANRGGFEKNLGDSTEGKRGPSLRTEPRGTPVESPLVFSKAGAPERRKVFGEIPAI